MILLSATKSIPSTFTLTLHFCVFLIFYLLTLWDSTIIEINTSPTSKYIIIKLLYVYNYALNNTNNKVLNVVVIWARWIFFQGFEITIEVYFCRNLLFQFLLFLWRFPTGNMFAKLLPLDSSVKCLPLISAYWWLILIPRST